MFKTIKRLIVWTGEKRRRLYIGFIYSFFCSIFTAMPIMGAAYALNLMLNDLNGHIILEPIWSVYAFLFMLLMILGRFVFSYLRAVTQDSIAYEVAVAERIKIGDILKRVSLGFFGKNNIGEIAATVTTDLSFMEMFAMKMIDTVINGYISTIVMLISLMFYSFSAAIIAAVGVILSFLSLLLLSSHSRKNAPTHQKAQDSMIAATLEYMRGISTVKAYGRIGASVKAVHQAYGDSRIINTKIEAEYIPFNCLHLLSLKLASVVIVTVTAISVIGAELSLPIFLMIAVFSFVIFGHIETINNAAHVMEVIDVSLNKLDNIKGTNFIDHNGKEQILSNYDISMKNVSFAYENRNVLNNISFTIPQGSTTAIVGPSGSGKSTICNLIARFYDVNTGNVKVGGIDIREFTGDSLLENISMVFQNVYLFNDTIINNIQFGNPNASLDDVIDAAKKARCHDFISKLSDGYNTIVGEGGSSLSGGEKQRISIARAILKNAPIIILDEATASIDPENEQLIQEAISALTNGKTMIVIAHRLATIENADQILVMEDGRIVQRGTNAKLITEEGLYNRFMTIRRESENWSI